MVYVEAAHFIYRSINKLPGINFIQAKQGSKFDAWLNRNLECFNKQDRLALLEELPVVEDLIEDGLMCLGSKGITGLGLALIHLAADFDSVEIRYLYFVPALFLTVFGLLGVCGSIISFGFNLADLAPKKTD